MRMLDFSDREAILKYVVENNVKILNLCHIPEDGRLRVLAFATADKDRLCEVLDSGERVDGSSLFSFIQPGKSDIYIVPRIKEAFANPFTLLPTLNILCDYLDENGKPLDVAPQTILKQAEQKLHSTTGIRLKALAELEFYVVAERPNKPLFPGASDRNYHEASPFAEFENVRNEVLATLAMIGIPTKYAHSEVGKILGDNGTIMEQHEIEFTSQDLEDMAKTIAVSKWVVRNVCARHGVSASFIPKIDLSHAGNGMHIHLCALKNGANVVADSRGSLSSSALKIIGGILRFAPSLSAFGNPTPVSYFRFLARKESPMHICWSARSRLALVRIPLWWSFKKKADASCCRETFEYRAPDAFANAYLLFAGLALAARHGLDNPKESMRTVEDLHANSVKEEEGRFKTLPRSCSEAAKNLVRDRKLYEIDGIFPEKLIDKIVQKLSDYADRALWKQVSEKPEELQKLFLQYLHYG